MSLSREEAMAELQKRLQDGHPDSARIQEALKGQTAPTISANGFQTTTSNYPQSNVPQGMEGRQNSQPTLVQSDAIQGNTGDIESILKRLQPTGGQSLANAMSVLGGGKPLYDPNMPAEFLKQGGALKYAMAPYQQQKLTAEAGLKNEQQKFVAPKAQADIDAKTSQADVNKTRNAGMTMGNNLLENAMKGNGAGGKTNMQISGVSAGGSRGSSVQMKNMDELGQEGAIRANVQGMKNQNMKVDSSIHALQLFEQGYDPQSNTFNIDPAQYKELAMNIANTIAQSGAGTGEDRAVIAQKTAQGDWLGIMQYVSGSPQNASSQEIFQRLYMSLKRQGKTSQRLKTGYADDLGVDPSSVGNDFDSELQNSPMENNQNQATPNLQPGQRLFRNKRTGETKVVNG